MTQPLLDIIDLVVILSDYAFRSKKRGDFNKLIATHHKRIGDGAFRFAYRYRNLVFKIRRAKKCPQIDWDQFDANALETSNHDEYNTYKALKDAAFTSIISETHYFTFDNEHDVIIQPYHSLTEKYNTYQMNIRKIITKYFLDPHYGNVGVNSQGIPIIFDLNIEQNIPTMESEDVIILQENISHILSMK